ncbi:MAG: chemotaxis protein CheW [Pseudorhodoplanes sp.]
MTEVRALNEWEYVTVTVDGQLFGLPIACVQDVFLLSQVTRVPLAPDDIAGIVNLRGRIVTAIDMRSRLGLGKRDQASPMAVGIDCDGESYGLVIDSVGEVLKLGADTAEPVPVNLDNRLKRVASGIHRLETELMVVLDVDRLLDLKPVEMAA